MHYTPFICGHGSQPHGHVLACGTICGPACDVFDLLTPAMPIPFHIDDHWVSESALVGGNRPNGSLQCIEGLAVPPDEKTVIAAYNVQDDLAFVTFILLDRCILNPKTTENAPQSGDRNIGNSI
jgi:hypothetical protein